jgi:DNA-binding helix-hairpin-helix protein with protein kinase domain
MNPPPSLITANGRPFPLDRQLASGGEGAVFTLPNDPGRVAKVYHKPPTDQTVEKLTAMIALANPKLVALAAWPGELLLHSRTRQVAGFVMPRLVDCQPIQHLYNPVQRLKFFARSTWAFQVRAAFNLVAAFDEIHKAGCLVGDVNQSNVQVSPQALVRLIDCDSFQVRARGKQFLCEVGVEHYTPPELQGKSLRGLVRTENHDRFGLAVLIYQLLFVGRHPYAGVYRGAGDPSFEQLIAEFRFAQGPAAHSRGMDPPPHTPTFADIPADVGGLFRRAFEQGSERDNARPQPGEWLAVLQKLEQNIAECAADAGHKYWRGLQACVWCRLAEKGGPEYYFGVAGGVGAFAVDEAKLQEILRRLAACRPESFADDHARLEPARAPVARPLPQGLADARKTSVILAIATAACVALMPFGVVRGFICLIGFLGALVFGVWLAVQRLRSPWHYEYHLRRLALDEARLDLDEIEREWGHRIQRYRRDHSALSDAVQKLVADCRGLAARQQVEVRQLTTQAEANALLRHLRLHLLSDAEIPRIGAARKQILVSCGICTAADVSWNVIHAISGFGDVLTGNLVSWREQIVRQFRFDPAAAISPGEQKAITVRLRTLQQQILAEADRQLTRLEALAPACRSALRKLAPDLKAALAAEEQAEADFLLLNRS